jgi:hypothetical protein
MSGLVKVWDAVLGYGQGGSQMKKRGTDIHRFFMIDNINSCWTAGLISLSLASCQILSRNDFFGFILQISLFCE